MKKEIKKCLYEGCYGEAKIKGFCENCYKGKILKAEERLKKNPNKEIKGRISKFSYDELWREK